MINPSNSDKTQLDALMSQGMSHRQPNNKLAESYKEQRQSFMLKRLQLQAQIMLIAGLTLIAFFLWTNSQDMQNAIAIFNAENNQLFRIRICISTSPVVAGVIGLKKFAIQSILLVEGNRMG